ncbi:uncharacterized protein LOC117181242 [Belonocnema kinseyi]|uniref:uncharacterized protein LOC117181242 n=1 Tax=Belonocnema kinseyi TaxID=2817044 RepID=UPI00143DF8E1|nr:uncharacterized protein LOC117181242 [Belonocnema kinseyi]
MMIQKLWKVKITWDDPVPLHIRLSWLELRELLPLLNKMKFDRCVITKDSRDIQIHGFCDASETGYGACLYLQSTDNEGMHHSSFLCSKSRVAPVQTVSIPRLELCAALLLVRLYTSTRKALQHLTISPYVFWSDSTVTLHWINSSPHSLKTFVSNCVVQIQEDT